MEVEAGHVAEELGRASQDAPGAAVDARQVCRLTRTRSSYLQAGPRGR